MFIICLLQIPASGARPDKPESSLIGLDRPVSWPQGTLQNTVLIVSQINYLSVGVLNPRNKQKYSRFQRSACQLKSN